jgi:N-acetylneuraminic acid mutarotase
VIKRSVCRATIFAVLLAVIFTSVATAAKAQGKWRLGAPIPQGANEVLGAAIDGQVFVYGGQDPSNKPQGIFYKYDPGKNNWTQLPANPVPVHHGAAVSIGHKFYVVGGFRLPDSGKGGWYPENKIWAFDTDTHSRICRPRVVRWPQSPSARKST